MKKLLVLMGLAAAAFSFTGCQKNEMKDADNDFKGTSTFELVADIAQTKTTLDPDYAVDWEEGDVIYMVTKDEEWGAAYSSDNNNITTIAEFVYADGKFVTESTISGGEHTFYAMYSRADQKTWHRGAGSSHSLLSTQSQDCSAPTAHIKLNDALVGTFTATTPMTEPAKVDMHHLYTLMQVNVKNGTGADIVVTKFEMTAADADLAGVFNVESFETPSISTKSGASSTITVNVANGAVKAGELLPVYFIMAPLSNYSGDVTFKVTDASGNTYTKTVTLSNMTFEAGKYNTTPYTISSADVVEPEPANVTWNLSTNETSEVSDTKIAWTSDVAEMYCEKGGASTNANNYYGGNADNRTSTRFYKNSILTIAPKAGYKITSVVFTATTEAYASALETSAWTNASAAATSEVVTVTPTNGAQSVIATIGGTCGFTLVVVYYAENEGGEEPETKTLASITISGQTRAYTVGDEFEFDGTVTATYSDGTTATVTPTSVSEPDMDAEGTKDVTVTYTEGGVTEETTYQITITEKPAEGEPVWTLVTDASSLAAGDQIVIVAKDYNYALSTTQNKNNRGQASVTKNGNTITLGSDVQKLTLETGNVSSTFAFNTGSGYLYAASSSSNYLKTETKLSANSSWSVTIAADGTATVVAKGSNTRNTMQYNPSSSIFACYSSASQKAIVLYKLQ